MSFRDFSAGQVFRSGPIRVTEKDIVEFAERYDPQWFHTDKDRATDGRWNGLIASGWHTCAIAMRLAWMAALKDTEESIGSPGLAYLKWTAPVRPDDQLRLEARVISAEIRRQDRGVLRWNWLLLNQNDEVVLDLEATSLFDVSHKN